MSVGAHELCLRASSDDEGDEGDEGDDGSGRLIDSRKLIILIGYPRPIAFGERRPASQTGARE